MGSTEPTEQTERAQTERIPLSEYTFQETPDPEAVKEIESWSLTAPNWNADEGFRLPARVQVFDHGTKTGACHPEATRYFSALQSLGQDWVWHDDVALRTDRFHGISNGLLGLICEIGDLHPDPVNARVHDHDQLDRIGRSLAAFGQHRPAVVRKQDNVITAGNAMVQAAKALGWTHVAALVIDESKTMATARALADNRLGELSSWDDRILGNLTSGLLSDGLDLDLVGFGDLDLSIDPEPVEAQETAAEEPREPDEPAKPVRPVVARRVYVSAPTPQQGPASDLAGMLASEDLLEICSTWHSDQNMNLTNDYGNDEFQQAMEVGAAKDLRETRECDIFIQISEEGSGGGMHNELGAAVALGKDVHVVGPRRSLFHYLSEVTMHDDTDSLFRALTSDPGQ